MLIFGLLSLTLLTRVLANYDPEDFQPEIEGVWEKSQRCGFTEVFYKCQPCDLLCGQDHKLCPIKKCQEGCGCPPNFRRNGQGACVEYFNCFSNLTPMTTHQASLILTTPSTTQSMIQETTTIMTKHQGDMASKTNFKRNKLDMHRKKLQEYQTRSQRTNLFPNRKYLEDPWNCEDNFHPFKSELDCLRFFKARFLQFLKKRSL